MSKITYNGVTLDVIRTKQFLQESVYDESDTDMMRMKFSIQVAAMISYVGAGDAINPANVGEVPTDAFTRIRHMLAVPRKFFSMTVNGHTLLQLTNPPDANNGPKPRLLSISRLSENTFMVDWGIEISIVECDGGAAPNSFLTLKWGQSVHYDQRWYATVHTAGYLIVNSSLLVNPDSLRSIVTPKPANGFQRTNATYTLSEDGLRLSFSFDDKQVFLLPTNPALKSSGKVAVITGMGEGGLQRNLIFSARMEGGPETKKSDMALALLSIWYDYAVSAGGLITQNGQFIYSGGLSCELWDNVVDLQLTTKLGLNPANVENSLRVNTKFLDITPSGYNLPPEGGTIAPPLQGQSDFLGLVAAAFNDMCLQEQVTQMVRTDGPDDFNTDMTLGSSNTPSTGDGPPSTMSQVMQGSGLTVSVGVVDTSLSDNDFYSDPDPGVYEFYTIVNEFKTNRNQAILPPCASANPASGAPSPKVAVVQLAMPVITLVSCWTAEKVGGPPETPPEDPPNSNAVLLDSLISPEGLKVSADGSSIRYTISGRFEYVFLEPTQVDPYSWPITPYLTPAIPDAPQVPSADTEIVFGQNGAASAAAVNQQQGFGPANA